MLFVLCELIIQPISATGGITAQYFLVELPPERVASVWLYWRAGNVLGQMLVLPFLLTWISTPGTLADREEIRRTLTANACQMQSVMRNFLSNALKFTPKNGRVIFSAVKKSNY